MKTTVGQGRLWDVACVVLALLSLYVPSGRAWGVSPAERLTHDGVKGANYSPTWSPDGSRIAFSSNRSRDRDLGVSLNLFAIWTMNADGSDSIALTRDEDPDFDPAWSPDGSEIAFRTLRAGTYHISVVDVDDPRNIRQLVSMATAGYPTWAPDGSRIAFEARCGDDSGIYIVGRHGSGLVSLTCGRVHQAEPAWSPDGSWIAVRGLGDGQSAIDLLAVDGGARTRLTHEGLYEGAPCWSPDGSWIAYQRAGPHELNAIRVDGSETRRISDEGGSPAWSPDGSRTAFRAKGMGRTQDIYVIDVSNIFPDVVAAMAGQGTAARD